MTTIAAQRCQCYKPRPQRPSERWEVECHTCKRVIEIPLDRARCSRCGARLEIDISPEARTS